VQSLDNALYQGIAIGDTGPGIPLADQAHIFERHYRGVQADGQTPGTGLGLAIVKDLITAMEGHIDIISPYSSTIGCPRPRPLGMLAPAACLSFG
jgi:signal transduction histidine kinase